MVELEGQIVFRHTGVRRFHHIGIPTEESRPGERYLKRYGMYVSGFESSPFGVEWMRFTAESRLPELVRTVPHVAFEVDDLEAELEGSALPYTVEAVPTGETRTLTALVTPGFAPASASRQTSQ